MYLGKFYVFLIVVHIMVQYSNIVRSTEQKKSLTESFLIYFERKKILEIDYYDRYKSKLQSRYKPTRRSPGGPDPKHH